LATTSFSRAADAAPDSLSAARSELYVTYGRQLTELATECDAAELSDLARRLRAWLPKRDASTTYLFLLDGRPDARAAPGAQRELESRWQKLRSAQAAALFALAKRAAAERRPSLAYELTTEAARESRDFKPAWRMSGYVKSGDAWRTPFEAQQLGLGNVWHARFGWLKAEHLARYQRGERFYRNRWMPAAEEARLRREAEDPWRIETDHYSVVTDDSLEEGVALAERLERLYAVWRQVFAGYLVSDAELADRFAREEPGRDRDRTKHRVVHYRSREEYNRQLSASQPQIGITLGLYVEDAHTAYFFAGEDQEPATLDHEATHQLFQECRPVARQVGGRDNFWIIEAAACYMESLEERDGYLTLGGLEAGRMLAARERLLKTRYYVPLDELVSLGRRELQHHADIARLYSQSAGLAGFLLARYPEATVKYIESVYTGTADHDTLRALTGQSYPQLDQQYRAFMQRAEPQR
jgi:hypothetical protein